MGSSQPDAAAARMALSAADRDADPVGWARLSIKYAHALGADVGAHYPEAERACRDALTVFRRHDYPADWYMASLTLWYLIVMGRPAGALSEQVLREALAGSRELSAAVDAAPSEASHAAAVALEANVLGQLAEGDQDWWTAACEAQRSAAATARTVAPIISADAMLALAELLIDSGSDRDKDDAIAALEDALTIYRRDEDLGKWVRCHWYLAGLLERGAASCPEVLKACAHLEEVVGIKPPVLQPDFYVKACNELAMWLSDGRCRQDLQRLDQAIFWSEESLKYRPEDEFALRTDHAQVLAMGYRRRAEMTHDDADLERAVALLDQAAGWARLSEAPAERVIQLVAFAAETYTIIRTNQRQNLEIAIRYLTSLLEEHPASQLPSELSTLVLQTAGNVYQKRITGDPADNLERGREYLETALSLLDRRADPDRWASVTHDLSVVYWKRIVGDQGENTEKAITYAEAALPIRTREKDPTRWARTVHHLGNLYVQRLHGDPAANIEKSIGLSLSALEVETRDDYPDEWAGANRNLGNAYLRRHVGDKRDNVEKAVSCFRDSSSVTASLGNMKAHGESLAGLGLALGRLGTVAGDQAALAESVTAYKHAAEAFGQLGSADSQAAVHFNLAQTLAELPGIEAAAEALEIMLKCLPVWAAGRNPVRVPHVYEGLATLTDRLGRAGEAYEWVCQAISANETLFAGATAEDSKIQLVSDSATLYSYAVDLALRSGAPPSEALVLAERGRARLLRESAVRIQPEWAIPASLLERESALIAQRRTAWGQATAPDPGDQTAERHFARVQDLTQQLDQVWEQMLAFPGGHHYVRTRRGNITWDQIRQWIKGQPEGFALLEYVVLTDRVIAFVVRQGRQEPDVVDIPLGLEAIARSVRALYREMDGSSGGSVRRETWDRIAEPLTTMVQPELAGARLLCIVPHLFLHHFPLHALGVAGNTLLDQMPVYYAQSAGLASQASHEPLPPDWPRTSSALVVGDTLGDLTFAQLEAKRTAQILGVRPLIGTQATLDSVVSRLPKAHIVHFACHGYLRIDEPRLSALLLADAALTAGHLQDSTLSCDLLVLSGCDTGFQPLERTLDAGGLPGALIAAGARTTIGSLWPVNDKVTADLFALFYQELLRAGSRETGGDNITHSIAGCLRAAELALRRTRPERYYWAAFTVAGTW